MQYYIKNYKVTIHAVSPIFVGSGESIGKKEYIYLPWSNSVVIPDLHKLYNDLVKKKLEKSYETFMIDGRNNQMPISKWFADNGFGRNDYERWKKYEMKVGGDFQNSRPKGIDTFVKDAYGMPYIPGSSIKGMFRTALLAAEIVKNPQKLNYIRDKIRRGADIKLKRNQYLTRETAELETEIFNLLKRNEKKQNAVNDCLSGLSVGDSRAISVDQLTLSQKIDYTLDGRQKPLPIFRETIIPGTDICFDVSIDDRYCPYDMEDIVEALDIFKSICNEKFYSHFKRNINTKNAVFLGGGCGFLSKTIIYDLFEEDAVQITDKIFQHTLGKQYNIHKHMRDKSLGVAPHVCKCTLYNDKLYDMGIGQIEFITI